MLFTMHAHAVTPWLILLCTNGSPIAVIGGHVVELSFEWTLGKEKQLNHDIMSLEDFKYSHVSETPDADRCRI